MNTGLEILNQLKVLGMNTLMVIGAHNFRSFSEENFTDIDHDGGLFFQVNGLKFKGKVMIRLSLNDT